MYDCCVLTLKGAYRPPSLEIGQRFIVSSQDKQAISNAKADASKLSTQESLDNMN
jgi:hypothetical protein